MRDVDDGWAIDEETIPGTALQTVEPTVSVVHELPDIDPSLVVLAEPGSPRAAAYRILRHRLFKANDPRVILVTSAQAREGKTTCASNLALALSECNAARVLLLEASGQAPGLAKLFRFQPPKCLFYQLAEHRLDHRAPWIVVEIAGTSVYIAAVSPASAGKQLVDWPAFQLAIDRFRTSFDYVIVDAPAVLGSAEVNLIQDVTDGVLLAVAAGQTRGRHVKRALEQLQPGRVLGIAVVGG